MDAAAHYLEDAIVQAAKIKALAEGAIAQLTDEELFQTIDPESNSVALVMRHVAGNLRSGHDPRRAAHRHPGAAARPHPRRLSRRTDRSAGEAPARIELEDTQHSARPVRGLQGSAEVLTELSLEAMLGVREDQILRDRHIDRVGGARRSRAIVC